MSYTISEETKNLPSITRFYGGDERGACLQLTKLEDREHQYITIRVKDISAFIKKLLKAKRMIDNEDKRH